ncbi:MAG: T9SS type A sorting domain-containing protein [candidate division Zixibacteria bacterium]|nr:T9SS type A sorting domain-containing protein [candidate division Zixibacteria bacterium]
MRNTVVFLFIAIITAGFAPAMVSAHWDPGDGHKMHYPQLPDTTGWDVNATFPVILADDWRCTQSGPVDEIHFWGSWRHGDTGNILRFELRIHEDIPADPPEIPYSRPGDVLWNYTAFNFDIRPLSSVTPEGWYDPEQGGYIPDDHHRYFQYNITDLPDPFVQEEGTIYWLSVTAEVEFPNNTRWGWKSSVDHWNDDAVWKVPGSDWVEMYEPPDFDESLDLSFVINGAEQDTCCCVVRMVNHGPDPVDCGGSFQITGTVCNTCNHPITTDVWYGVSAFGNFYQQGLFNNIPLNPGQCISGLLTQHVPTFAPTGIYRYVAYCGEYSTGEICDSASFEFNIVCQSPNAKGGDWYTEGNLFGIDVPVPGEYSLIGNYPNPFNATTTITYELPVSGNVNLEVYNIKGQLVETLVAGHVDAGTHNVSWDASQYSSGVYFYKLTAGDTVLTKRMTLLK